MPEAGCERLARSAGIHNPVGIETLDRADRGTVVSILGVVVVLDHERPALAAPTRSPPCAHQHHA